MQLASNLTENVCLMLGIETFRFYSQNARIVFVIDFEQLFYKSFLVENLCFIYL